MVVKEAIKIWNTNFDKGVSPFQMVLMASMIWAVIKDNQFMVLFSMFVILFAYFEDTDLRWAYRKKEAGK